MQNSIRDTYRELRRYAAVLLIVCLFLTCLLPYTGASAAATSISVGPESLTLPLNFVMRSDKKGGKITMRMITNPIAQPTDGMEWFSSNPGVASIDNNGNITLVSQGSTTITAKLGALSSVNACTLTVTAPLNRSAANKNLLNLPPQSNRINIAEFLAFPTGAFGSAHIALWGDNKQAAYSVTGDDGLEMDMAKWWSLRERYGVILTEFSPSVVTPPYTKFIPWTTQGVDVQSHTKTHAVSVDQDAMSTAQYIDELYHPIETLNLLPNNKVKTISYAQGFADYEMTRLFYTAARGGVGFGLNPASPNDYLAVSHLSWGTGDPLHQTTKNTTSHEGFFGGLLSTDYGVWNTSAVNGWAVSLSHYISGADTVHPEIGMTNEYEFLEFAFDNYLYPNRDLIWTENFTNTACYAQERDNATLSVIKAEAGEIRFTLTDELDDEYFDYPLTVNVLVDSTWNKLSATQGGNAVEAKFVKKNGNYYAVVKAVPDRGEVILTNTGTVQTLSSNAKLSAFTYKIDAANKAASAEKIPIEGFSPSDNGGTYYINFAPDTRSVGIYATPADSGATQTHDPLMSIMYDMVPGAPGRTATFTITAPDETVLTYKVVCSVIAYSPVTALALNVPENLEQYGDPQVVEFAVADGTVPANISDIDPDSIEWYLDGVKQTEKGRTYKFTAPMPGVYEIYAKSNGISSVPRVVNITAAPPEPDIILFANDFDHYVPNAPLPMGSPESAEFDFAMNGAQNVKAMDGHGNVLELYNNSATANALLGKMLYTEGKPIIFMGKMMHSGNETNMLFTADMTVRGMRPDGTTFWDRPGFSIMNIPQQNFNVVSNGKWGSPDWSNSKWSSAIYSYNQYDIDEANKGLATSWLTGDGQGWFDKSGRLSLGANSHETTIAKGQTPYLVYTVQSFKKDTNTVRPVYIDDIKIFVPGSFTMRAAQPDGVNPNATSVKMLLNHPAIPNTLTPQSVWVKEGTTMLPITSVVADPYTNDSFTINFPEGTLLAGKEYTVGFTSAVSDIVGKRLNSAAVFNTIGGEAFAVSMTDLHCVRTVDGIKVNLKATNNTADAIAQARIFNAAYKDGVMVAVSITDTSFASRENKTINGTNLTGFIDNESYTIKTYIWNGNNMPLSKAGECEFLYKTY